MKNWPYPSADWLAKAKRLAAEKPQLEAVLAGERSPENGEQAARAAYLAYGREDYGLAERMFRKAFDADAALLDVHPHRYKAALAAALHYGGQSRDARKLDTEERALLRKRAHAWLEAQLTESKKTLAGSDPARLAKRMAEWLRHRAFASLRGTFALRELPEGERVAWKKLWSSVRSQLDELRAAE